MNKKEYQIMHVLENSHFWFVGKRFFIETYLKKIRLPVKKILDIGIGTGGTTKFLQKFGQVTGVEKNKVAIVYAKKRGLNILEGEAEKLPVKNSTFDLVTIFDVLYHKNVKNVNLAVQEIYRVLKPGGYLLITDSAFTFLRGHHSQTQHEARRFTVKQLKKTLSNNSFKTIRSSYIFFSVFPLILLKRKIIDKLLNNNNSDAVEVPVLINNFLIRLLKLESFLLNYLSLPVGSSLIILAKKR